jgi:hypothetical protein
MTLGNVSITATRYDAVAQKLYYQAPSGELREADVGEFQRRLVRGDLWPEGLDLSVVLFLAASGVDISNLSAVNAALNGHQFVWQV